MISFSTIASIYALHWLFDFKLQTAYMSHNKSKSIAALLAHVEVYTCGVLVMLLFNYHHSNLLTGLLWVTFNVVAHGAIDAVSSRLSSKLFAKQEYGKAFDVIGFDQMLHMLCLFGSFIYLR